MAAYTSENFKSKAALRRALAEGATVTLYPAGLGSVPTNGEAAVEGPHYPAAHTWYARVKVVNGRVEKVLS